MDLGLNVSRGRCAAVWSAITCAAAGLVALLLPTLQEATGAARSGGLGAAGFESLLVGACAAAAAATTCWLWAVATVVVLDTALDLPPDAPTGGRGVPDGVRRAVLVLCGAALTTGLAAPALAGGQGPARPHVLAGLRLPERVAVEAGVPRPVSSAVAARRQATSPAPRQGVVVGPGDTLWSLAAETLGPGASAEEIAASWPAIYAHNRDLIGPDPGLIQPGQRLLLPLSESEGTGR